MSDTILYELREPGVGLITLNRPDSLNAWSPELGGAYFRQLDACMADDAVKVVVITGAGKGYCAGADMKVLQQLESMDESERDGSVAAGARQQTEILSMPKPIIAAINGACAGLGFVQAMMCDIRFAAAGAKFTTAFAKRGLIAEYGVSWVLPRLVGHANALDLLFSSRVVMAEEAFEMGMVNKVLPPDQLLDFTLSYASEMARDVCPTSIAVMKKQVYGDFTASFEESAALAGRYMKESLARPDFAEGIASFLQKRQAVFRPIDPSAL